MDDAAVMAASGHGKAMPDAFDPQDWLTRFVEAGGGYWGTPAQVWIGVDLRQDGWEVPARMLRVLQDRPAQLSAVKASIAGRMAAEVQA